MLQSSEIKNGGLLNAPYDIKDKRVEHFSDLWNQPSDIDLSIADDIDQHWIKVFASMSLQHLKWLAEHIYSLC